MDSELECGQSLLKMALALEVFIEWQNIEEIHDNIWMAIEKFIKCRVVSSLYYWAEKLQNREVKPEHWVFSDVIYDLVRKLILRLCRKEKTIGLIWKLIWLLNRDQICKNFKPRTSNLGRNVMNFVKFRTE